MNGLRSDIMVTRRLCEHRGLKEKAAYKLKVKAPQECVCSEIVKNKTKKEKRRLIDSADSHLNAFRSAHPFLPKTLCALFNPVRFVAAVV